MPAGTMLSDGTHSATTAANPSVDITGWNSSTLSMTTPVGYNDTVTLQVTAKAPEAVAGSIAGISQNLTIQVNTVAQVPTLTLIPLVGSVSRTVIETSWPRVNNDSYNATILDITQFAGWSTTPVARGKDAAFEVWANGQSRDVQAPAGTGTEWLGLSNGVGSSYQAPGIVQTIHTTIAGAQYMFNFDYAGQLGLSSANTQIGVYLDGQVLGLYGNTSTDSLNWRTLGYSFQGDGRAHTLSIELINGTNTGIPPRCHAGCDDPGRNPAEQCKHGLRLCRYPNPFAADQRATGRQRRGSTRNNSSWIAGGSDSHRR